MGLILAADTGTDVLTVALWAEEGVRAEVTAHCPRLHSERIVPLVDWILAQGRISLSDITALAIGVGPGSFTGLRIGAATWKGLALANNLPLVAVPSLDAMARLAAEAEGYVCPVLDARMKEVYGAIYRYEDGRREKLTEDRVCPVDVLLDELPEDARPTFLGDGVGRYGAEIRARLPRARFAPPAMDGPRASAVAEEASALLTAGVETNPEAVNPVYLRKSQAEMNRERQG